MSDTASTTSVAPSGQLLVRNVAVLMASQVGTWGLSLVAVVAIPRFLSPGLLGRYQLAGSVWALAAVVMGFGMSLTLIKGIARDPARVGPLLGACVALRMLIWVPATIVVFGYALAVGYSRQVLVLMVIVGVSSLVVSVSDGISAALQGLDRMGSMAVAAVSGRLVFVVGVVILLVLGFRVYSVAIIATVGFATTLAIQAVLLRQARRELDDPIPLSATSHDMVALARESLPYFWIALAIVLYQQVDVITISLVVDSDEVLGWYSVYERLTGTFMFVPAVMMTAVFPTLSRLYGNAAVETTSSGLSTRMIRKAFNTMVLIALPIGFGAAAISESLVVLLFGEPYREAGAVLMVGGGVLVLTYLTTTLGMFLVAMDKQRQWTLFILLGAVLTIPLDVVLVPMFQENYGNGAVGAVLAFLLTESVTLAGAIYLLPSGSLDRSNVWFAVRTLFAAIIMVSAVLALGTALLPVRVAAGVAVFSAMAGLLRLVTPEDREMVFSQIRRAPRVDA